MGLTTFFQVRIIQKKAYLELTLYYQFEEINKFFLPALNSENLQNISLRVRLMDKLSFSDNQSGKVSLFTTKIKRTIAQVPISDVINEQKTIEEEKLNNLSLKIKALNKEIIDGETKIKDSLLAHENLISEKLRQLEFSFTSAKRFSF